MLGLYVVLVWVLNFAAV